MNHSEKQGFIGDFNSGSFADIHFYNAAVNLRCRHKRACRNIKKLLCVWSDEMPLPSSVVGENGKPAPDIYLLAAERLGVSPEACIGVEDSLNGVRAIHAAGMRAIMIPDMIPPTPDVERLYWKRCDRLTDLIPILASIN